MPSGRAGISMPWILACFGVQGSDQSGHVGGQRAFEMQLFAGHRMAEPERRRMQGLARKTGQRRYQGIVQREAPPAAAAAIGRFAEQRMAHGGRMGAVLWGAARFGSQAPTGASGAGPWRQRE